MSPVCAADVSAQMREMQMSFQDDYGELEMQLQKAKLQLEMAAESEGAAAAHAARAKSLQSELETLSVAFKSDREKVRMSHGPRRRAQLSHGRCAAHDDC